MKVVSWNIEGRLTRFNKEGRGSPEHIVERIRELNGDVVFLAEASDNDDIDSDITVQLEGMGYEIRTVSYDHKEKARKWAAEAEPNMKLLTRLAITSFRQIRLGDIRNALTAEVIEPSTGQAVRVIGVHLDDRRESLRLKQVKDLLIYLHDTQIPTVIMGDFNAMHGDDVRARLLRHPAIREMVSLWPHARTRNIIERLSDMAAGDALQMLETESDMRDTDTNRRATTTPKMRFQEWMPSVPMVQIDHLYISPELSVNDFRVGSDGGSDHRSISAYIGLKHC